MKRSFILFCCLVMVWNGCAQYKRPPLMIKVPDYYDQRGEINQLHVVTDPYFETSRMEYLFNNDILDRGFLAVHFIAFNFGEETYDLSKSRLTLIRSDGMKFLPSDPKLVGKKVLKHTSIRMIGWGFAGLIVLSIPLSIIAGIDSHRSNRSTKKAVTQQAIRVYEIGQKEIVEGFYFFRVGKKRKEIKRAREFKYQIRIESLIENETGKMYDFLIGLN